MATPNRPLQIGPSSGPTAPYPLLMSGTVISGFGRGSKELGIPTANLPVDSSLTPWISSTPSGVYFGWASLRLPADHPDRRTPQPSPPTSTSSPPEEVETSGFQIYPMVMSIGYNPFYKNTVRSAEVHILSNFSADFYGAEMRLLITGFIREEKDYSGLEALIADINFDCEVARRSLAREAWMPREVEVEVEVEGDGDKVDGVEEKDGVDGEGERQKRKVKGRGTLDCSWLIRPVEEGK